MHQVSSLLEDRSLEDSNKNSRSELHTHADTCCVGANTTPFTYSEETVSVPPFIDSYSPAKDVKIASAITTYDDPKTGDTVFLVLQMKHSTSETSYHKH